MKWLLFLAALAGLCAGSAAELPAFPGAEGHGATTPGGRGGKVIRVTSLADSGPGSLREALLTKGPRVVVFAIGGIIDLKKDITVREPYLTLAGQSAPGDGICLRGAALRIATHDVIVRYLRVRVGDDPNGPNPDNRDGIGISDPMSVPHHIVLDHCSVSWAIDENVQLWYPCHDITIQWCLIAESLERSLHPKGAHGMGLLVGDHARRISIHHNLLAHHMDRSPLLKGDTLAEVVANVIYNWRNHGTALTDLEGSGLHNAVIRDNLYLPGPQTRAGQPGITLQRDVKPGSQVILSGNRLAGLPTDAVLNRSTVTVTHDLGDGATDRIRPTSSDKLLEEVLTKVGATRPARDAVDARVVQAVRTGGGRIIDRPADVGGWPTYRSAPPRPDRDGDGLPDAWEEAHALNPADSSDAARPAPSGYSWIEVYLDEVAAGS